MVEMEILEAITEEDGMGVIMDGVAGLVEEAIGSALEGLAMIGISYLDIILINCIRKRRRDNKSKN